MPPVLAAIFLAMALFIAGAVILAFGIMFTLEASVNNHRRAKLAWTAVNLIAILMMISSLGVLIFAPR
jgi:hypothetical protein